jgi:3-deoxy-D-manno-octulosonic-acid transferase
VHLASVGEAAGAASLLRALAAWPERPRVLVTASTVPGREKARALPGVDRALLAPADFYPCVSAFLSRFQPSALVLIEGEFWPMTMHLAHRRGVPIVLANGRMTEKAFRRNLLLKGFFGSLFGLLRAAAVQTQADARRFSAFGLGRGVLRVAGNLKYDPSGPGEGAAVDVPSMLARIGWTGPVWAAGSTRRGEEGILLEAHLLAREACPELRWILAPRHPERCGEVAQLLRKAKVGFALWSELEALGRPPEGPLDCLLIDRFGVLSDAYRSACVCFVGGTLVPEGGHNVLEPARAGRPVFFGPHTSSIQEPADALLDLGGGARVVDARSSAEVLKGWIGSPEARDRAASAARRAAESFMGATARTLDIVGPAIRGR